MRKTHAVLLRLTLVAIVQMAYSVSLFEDGRWDSPVYDEYDNNEAVVDERDKIDPLVNQTSQFNAWFLGSPSRECPKGFSYRKHQCASCYKLITTPQSWEKSVDDCQKLHPDAHLAFISSEEEHVTVLRWLETQPVGLLNAGYLMLWLGGQRSNPADGTTPFYWKTARGFIHHMHYAKWCSGEPNNYHNAPESCFVAAGKWNFEWIDVPCWWSYYSICEYDP